MGQKYPWSHSLRGAKNCYGLYLQELHKVLTVWIQERFLQGSGKENGKVAIVKHLGFSLQFQGKEFDIRKWNPPHITPLAFMSHLEWNST